MENYDEDLNDNSFFVALKDSHPDLFAQCVCHGWLICVPRRDSLPKYAFTDEDYFDHILKPQNGDDIENLSRRLSTCGSSRADSLCSSLSSDTDGYSNGLSPESHGKSVWNYKTLSHVNADYRTNQWIKLDEAVLQKSHNNNVRKSKHTTVKVLFEETFYTDDKKKYKVLCMESPLYSRMTLDDCENAEDLWNVSSLRDCIDFLWMKGKLRVLESYDAYIKLFLHNHKNLDNLPMAIQRDLVYTLYVKCLNFAVTYGGSLDGSNSQHILRVATETYVLHGVYKSLMGALTSASSQEDGCLNKIIRNLSEIHPQDLDIDAKHWENLTRARQELGRLNMHTSPLTKLNCLKKTLRHLRTNPLVDTNDTGILGTEELLPIWVYLILQTPLANWNAQLQFLSTFRFSVENLSDDENTFYTVTLEAALAHLKTGKVLGLAAGERDVGVGCELNDTHHVHHDEEETSDEFKTEMFLAVKTGNSSRLEELISEYENRRKNQDLTVRAVDQSLLCHPLCNCSRCAALVAPSPPESVIVPAMELTNDNGLTLLHLACIYGRPKIVDFLINTGAPLGLSDSQGTTPLHYAASRGHQNALLLLLHAGAIMEPFDKMCRTPLHLAAQNGHEGCVKALIYYAEHSRQHLNMSPRDFNGNTPLHEASRWGFQGIVQILVENGASISIANNRLSTPVDGAHDIHVTRILQRSVRRRSWVQPHHGDFINIEVVPNDESDGILMLISEPTSDIGSNETAAPAETSPVVGTKLPDLVSGNSLTPEGSSRARRHSAIVAPTFSTGLLDPNPKVRRHSIIIPPTIGTCLTIPDIPEGIAVTSSNLKQEDFIVNESISNQEIRRVSRDESQLVRKVSIESLDNIAVDILPELPSAMGVKRKRENQSRDMRRLFTSIAGGDVPLSLFYLGIPAEELESSENFKDVLERIPQCHPLCPCNRCVAKNAGLGLNINQKNLDGLTPLHMAIQYGLLSLVRVLYRFGADINMKSGFENISPLQYAYSKNENDIINLLVKHGAVY